MWCYQVAAYRRSKNLASIVAFGSPVDTLAALPMGLPPNLAPAIADFMADHVFTRLNIPSWLARTGFQMMDPLKTAKARVDFVRQLHDREALLPREQQRRFLESEGWIAWSGPAISELLKQFIAHNRMMTRRFRRQRADGDAYRYHLPDTGVRRRGRRHRPARGRARYPEGGAERRGVRIPHPHRTFRPGGGIQGGQGELADRRRMGALALHRWRQAGEHRPDGRSAGGAHRQRRGIQFSPLARPGRVLRGDGGAGPRCG